MADLIVQPGHSVKAGGAYSSPGDLVTIEDPEEAQSLVDRGVLDWATEEDRQEEADAEGSDEELQDEPPMDPEDLAPEPETGEEEDEGEESDDDPAEDAEEATEPTLPEGYTTEHVAGGYYNLFAPDGEKVVGPSKGKWQGEDGAIQGAIAHAEVHAED